MIGSRRLRLGDTLLALDGDLLVISVATWEPETRTFVLHTPRESARKDWVGGAMIVSASLFSARMNRE